MVKSESDLSRSLPTLYYIPDVERCVKCGRKLYAEVHYNNLKTTRKTSGSKDQRICKPCLLAIDFCNLVKRL